MNMQRRDFIKTGGLAGGALGLNMLGSLGLPRNLLADGHSGNKKMLFIFQRGGNDGINAVIPRGDSEYNTTNRPTLFLRESGECLAAFCKPMSSPEKVTESTTKLFGISGYWTLGL